MGRKIRRYLIEVEERYIALLKNNGLTEAQAAHLAMVPALVKQYQSLVEQNGQLKERIEKIEAKPDHSNVLIKRNTESMQATRKMNHLCDRLNTELTKMIKQNTLRTQISEPITEEHPIGPIKWELNYPIDLFVTHHLEITRKLGDTVPITPAHRMYRSYTENPVDESDFWFYIIDKYPDVSRTKKKGEFYFTGCKLRKADGEKTG